MTSVIKQEANTMYSPCFLLFHRHRVSLEKELVKTEIPPLNEGISEYDLIED